MVISKIELVKYWILVWFFFKLYIFVLKFLNIDLRFIKSDNF